MSRPEDQPTGGETQGIPGPTDTTAGITTPGPGSSTLETPEPPPETPSRWHDAARAITTGNALVAFLSVLMAVVIGSLLVLITDETVRETSGYVFSRPGDFLEAAWRAISGAYSALFRGSVYNSRGADFAAQIRPLTETLKFASPLIMAGLGVGLAFRAGLFNIGGRGQMLLAGAAAGWVGINVDLPFPLHLAAATIAGMLAGALWAGLAGLLKARTGAHEVIVTIMLNYVAFYLLFYALSRQSLLQAPGSINPKSLPVQDSAILPDLLGQRFNLHAGLILALVSVVVVWWLLNRSALGFRFRAVGANPHAARTAGIDVGRTYVVAMLIAGALVGMAGANQILGTTTSGVTVDLDAGIGFDAITVALLGRSHPVGVLGAGLLFGAFKAGGFSMQASEGIPVDIVLVIQSLIVLFIAAPPLVRAMFRLPAQEAK
ncbi:beta-methylgalactoside transporter inner membrane component [Nocardioides dokdonensis FR1436]|uniref:Beta-methylgalactoside transporter inner membrane component n=1 Tax=Nocardioides dokdonensis FR1436 TaxID=1300347 RepID=A0A1A9GEJ8_9ACTN|nr:ABC transporter permease [Nocardioides dokdonensis]ANH36697.1 beta-methylgalactoside transporter inner membrane component [Nocardioides dokdonensis FR1436]